jgi:hypothetical protein
MLHRYAITFQVITSRSVSKRAIADPRYSHHRQLRERERLTRPAVHTLKAATELTCERVGDVAVGMQLVKLYATLDICVSLGSELPY